MIESFYTIENESNGYYEEKLSKFISYAYSVENECKVKEILENIHKMHKFARHIVYSYIIIDDNKILKKYSDDGEPSKTAGYKAMSLLEAKNLSNVLIVVVRYFGGTLLGAGHLARAYLASAKDCIEKNNIIIKSIASSVTINIEYKDLDKVLNIAKNMDILISDITYNEKILISAKIPKQKSLNFIKSISNYAKETDIVVKGECYI